MYDQELFSFLKIRRKFFSIFSQILDQQIQIAVLQGHLEHIFLADFSETVDPRWEPEKFTRL